MELENYLDCIQEDTIRIKGNRIRIEIVLEDYLEDAGIMICFYCRCEAILLRWSKKVSE